MARAPREHSVFFRPFENALVSGEAALPKDAAMRPQRERAIGSPSVLMLASLTLDNTYALPKRTKALARDRPLKFACVVNKVCWRFFQGSDPVLTESAHGFVARQLQPHIAVRLNEWPEGMSPDVGIRTYTTYGARCEHVITVPDLLPDHLRQTDASGVREHALALMLHELFEVILSLLVAFPAHLASDDVHAEHSRSTSDDDSSDGSSAASGSEDDDLRATRRQQRRLRGKRLPRVVYIHCAAGKERSRFVTVALHAALYVLNMRARGKDRLDVQNALRSWADRQTCFSNNQLSIRTLLTHNPDDMLPILAHTIARLAGLTARADLESVLETIRRAEQGLSRKGNYHNVCSAGADCPRRSDQFVELLCACCHSAFFCSQDCFTRCNHVEKCATHFHVNLDIPSLLQASAMEQHAAFSQSRRARARSESAKLGKAVPPGDAQ